MDYIQNLLESVYSSQSVFGWDNTIPFSVFYGSLDEGNAPRRLPREAMA
jgi:hypothetical protein